MSRATVARCPVCDSTLGPPRFRRWQILLLIFMPPIGLWTLLAGRKPPPCATCAEREGRSTPARTSPARRLRAGRTGSEPRPQGGGLLAVAGWGARRAHGWLADRIADGHPAWRWSARIGLGITLVAALINAAEILSPNRLALLRGFEEITAPLAWAGEVSWEEPARWSRGNRIRMKRASSRSQSEKFGKSTKPRTVYSLDQTQELRGLTLSLTGHAAGFRTYGLAEDCQPCIDFMASVRPGEKVVLQAVKGVTAHIDAHPEIAAGTKKYGFDVKARPVTVYALRVATEEFIGPNTLTWRLAFEDLCWLLATGVRAALAFWFFSLLRAARRIDSGLPA